MAEGSREQNHRHSVGAPRDLVGSHVAVPRRSEGVPVPGLMLFTRCHLVVLAPAGKGHVQGGPALLGSAAHLQQVLGEPATGTALPQQPLVLQQAGNRWQTQLTLLAWSC